MNRIVRFASCFLWLVGALSLSGQSRSGELRFKVVDPAGLAVKSAVELSSAANEFHGKFTTDENGNVVAKRLRYGVYLVKVEQPGFAAFSASLEVRSAVPVDYTIQLKLGSVSATVQVSDADTLVDPHRAGEVNEIGAQIIQDRLDSLPGRSLQDLVNSQPGWLYEGNAVLHPRGSEYQTQFIVDGIPLLDNRSPGFGPEIEADDLESMAVYTAGFPAEYGRSLGGVVELNTLREAEAGLHGEAVLSGGSFDTADAYSQVQYAWGKSTIGASASGGMTSHYLNPVVPQNFTNNGTVGDFSVRYERDFTPNDRLNLLVRHELSRYELPDEQVQEANGQLQTRDNFETMGIVSYQHIFSPDVVADFRGMIRDDSNSLNSNPLSTPVIAFQQNHFREGYFKSSVSVHHGRHEIKAGMESDNAFLHERFNDTITDPDNFDPGTPPTFSFPNPQALHAGDRPDLEQSVFVQDQIRLGAWSVNAGLRWDHYQLLVNQNAFSPRLSVARYFARANLLLHFSYDRIFQTPSFENMLISSSPLLVSLDPIVLRLPVLPSHGNYYEAGATKAFWSHVKLDVNYFRRLVNNYADDDQLLSTAVSFPIAFRKAVIYGGEGKITIPDWHHFSGFVSYSYIVGNAWLPVTGGLFLGDDATNALTQLSGHFPDSQDQRNTARVRMRYQAARRLWFAGGAEYGSGLPFEFTGTIEDALATYSQAVVDRLNFDRGRVKPSLSVNASVGVDLYKTERWNVRLQADAANLNNRLNVIDFGGLFSGNAIGPPRSYAVRLKTNF